MLVTARPALTLDLIYTIKTDQLHSLPFIYVMVIQSDNRMK